MTSETAKPDIIIKLDKADLGNVPQISARTASMLSAGVLQIGWATFTLLKAGAQMAISPELKGHPLIEGCLAMLDAGIITARKAEELTAQQVVPASPLVRV